MDKFLELAKVFVLLAGGGALQAPDSGPGSCQIPGIQGQPGP